MSGTGTGPGTGTGTAQEEIKYEWRYQENLAGGRGYEISEKQRVRKGV